MLETIDTTREATAERFRGAAAKLRATDIGESFPVLGTAAEATAVKLDVAASYLETHDCDRLMAEGRAAVSRNPAQSLLVAAGVGLVAGIVLRRRV